MKLGIVIYTTDAETAWNGFRLGVFALKQGDQLDKEEQDILDSFERGEWRPVANREREIARHMQYAKNTLARISASIFAFHPKTWRKSRPLR